MHGHGSPEPAGRTCHRRALAGASSPTGGGSPRRSSDALRRLRSAYKAANFEPPTNSEGVKATMRGIRRTLRSKPTRKKPTTAALLALVIGDLPTFSTPAETRTPGSSAPRRPFRCRVGSGSGCRRTLAARPASRRCHNSPDRRRPAQATPSFRFGFGRRCGLGTGWVAGRSRVPRSLRSGLSAWRVEALDLLVALPQLHSVAVDQLLSTLLSGVFILANDIDPPGDVTMGFAPEDFSVQTKMADIRGTAGWYRPKYVARGNQSRPPS